MSTDFSAQAVPQPAAQYVQPVVVGDKYVNLSGTATVKSGEGWLAGVFVNSTTGGTLKVYDNTSAAGTVIFNTHVMDLGWNPMPAHFMTGCHMVLANTMDWTVIYS